MLSQQRDVQQHAQVLREQSAVTAAYATATDVATALAVQHMIAAATKSEVDLAAHALLAVTMAHEHQLSSCDRLKHRPAVPSTV